jgi:hypothetical protein
MTEMPIVAMSGNSSFPLRRSGVNRRVDQPAERGAYDECNPDAEDVSGANQVHEKIGGEGTERDKIGMRKVDLHEHAVDQRQA